MAINETNFPDENFRIFIAENVDKNEDGSLSEEEIAAVTSFYIRDADSRSILSLTGIKYFKNLQKLTCDTSISELDVSGCTALTSLDCGGNNLSELDVSGCTALTSLYCFGNNLSELDVSGCTALTSLGCSRNNLSELDVSGCTVLTSLDCSYNNLSELDVSGCTVLTSLDCSRNNLSELDVGGCTALTSLDCEDNNLDKLDMSSCTALTELCCGNNNLSKVVVNQNLRYFYCRRDEFTHLSSSDENIATITNGTVYIEGVGSCTITEERFLSSADFTASFILIVTDKASEPAPIPDPDQTEPDDNGGKTDTGTASGGSTDQNNAATGDSNTVSTGSIEVKGTAVGESYMVGNANYKVLTSGTKGGTVEYTGSVGKAQKSVKIPNTVTINGNSYKVTSIAEKAFYKNTSLTKVTVGANVTSIGASAFEKCTKLKTVVIGKNVKKIAKKAFSGDTKLSMITVKSKALTSVGKKALPSVKNLKIKVPKAKKKAYKKLFLKKGAKSFKIS